MMALSHRRHFAHRVFYFISAILACSAVILLTFTASISPALAQNGEPTDDEVNAVARQLYCPVCENTPLDVCPTQACIQWRATIKEKLAAGWTDQQIKDYFVEQYGERVLAQPSARGWNILVWVLPPLIMVVAATIFIVYLKRMLRPVPAAATSGSGNEKDDYARRLEDELAKRR